MSISVHFAFHKIISISIGSLLPREGHVVNEGSTADILFVAGR